MLIWSFSYKLLCCEGVMKKEFFMKEELLKWVKKFILVVLLSVFLMGGVSEFYF